MNLPMPPPVQPAYETSVRVSASSTRQHKKHGSEGDGLRDVPLSLKALIIRRSPVQSFWFVSSKSTTHLK